MAGYNLTSFEQDTRCFRSATSAHLVFNYSDCNVTRGMVSFLNLTNTGGVSNPSFIDAYCLSPPANDDCPFGYCSNSDVAGPLVRVGAYLSNLLLSIQIFHSPGDVDGAFQAQLLTVFSLLFATCLSLGKHQLSKFHAVISSLIVGSPVTLYLWVYALLSLFGIRHRLSNTLGPAPTKPTRDEPPKSGWRKFACLLVLSTMVTWVSVVIFIYAARETQFTQSSCNQHRYNIVISKFYGAFFYLIYEFVKDVSPLSALVVAIPVLMTGFAWVVAALIQRHEAHKRGKSYSLKFWVVWRSVGEQYPFIHFMIVVVLPSAYWFLTLEFGLLISRDNIGWNVSFGQVLSVFIIVQPTLQVMPLIPQKLWPWFTHLTWVQMLCCCRCRASQRRRVPRSARTESVASNVDPVEASEIGLPALARTRMGSTESVWSVDSEKKCLP